MEIIDAAILVKTNCYGTNRNYQNTRAFNWKETA